VTHKELGLQLLMRLVEELGEDGQMEVEPKMEGMNMFTIISPRRAGAPNKPKPKPTPAPQQQQPPTQQS
jgi:hypothetical protein